MTQQPDTVYASAGGNRYHRSSNCSALEMGQNIHDYDCDCWGRCEHGRAHYVLETTPSEARMDGKTPCRVCLSGTGVGPSEDDFGHEPVYVVTNGKFRTVECYRCSPVTWPCTTAVVLGLAPRTAA